MKKAHVSSSPKFLVGNKQSYKPTIICMYMCILNYEHVHTSNIYSTTNVCIDEETLIDRSYFL